jgi:hypothetical protein
MYLLISGYKLKMYRIPRIQATELKVNKQKGPSEDASNRLGRGIVKQSQGADGGRDTGGRGERKGREKEEYD